ncbi:hypothetical protein L226DRAFT_399163 [Lentinus tigrinus ALCF2SS1-7]|uniref:uncharacterized protein n=1 Tax=Lentinus tigrinus ALCF2SS1-7 TaxID=1328758 RepID=UPI001165D889|nr:hypothetical protein L226DRAFT_399163 [Lentinus tigrinus ALCF2SS1-7]
MQTGLLRCDCRLTGVVRRPAHVLTLGTPPGNDARSGASAAIRCTTTLDADTPIPPVLDTSILPSPRAICPSLATAVSTACRCRPASLYCCVSVSIYLSKRCYGVASFVRRQHLLSE